MYTFGILAVFFLLLSAIIYKGKIKKNQFMVASIVLAGTFLGCVIVNGVVGLKIPYTQVVTKQRPLRLKVSEIRTLKDTVYLKNTYIKYKFEIDKKDTNQYVDFNSYGDYLRNNKGPKTEIVFLQPPDSIPYYQRFREIRVTDSKWITAFGLPRGKMTFVFHIPNDSIHRKLMTYINKNFFKNENKTAKLN